MPAYVISEIDAAKQALTAMLADGAKAVRLAPGDPLDAAGAQLLAAAVLSARAAGRVLAVELPAAGAAADLWRSLALDSLAETSWQDGGGA